MEGSEQSFAKIVDFSEPINVDPKNTYTKESRFRVESEFMENYDNCREDVLRDVKEHSKNYEVNEVSRLFEIGKITGQNSQQAVACIINGLQKNPEDPYMKSLLKNFETISKGSFGAVYTAENDGRPLFIVKRPNDVQDEFTQNVFLHESFMGVAAVNQTRKKTPGFIYTYGVIICNGTRKLQRKDAQLQWCSGNGPSVPYIALENVGNSKTLEAFIKDDVFDVKTLAKLLLQVESALKVASEECNFTHYDLHDGNVLIQKLDSPINIPIYIQDQTFYMETDLVVRIIDYGLAYAEINGKQFGVDIPTMFKYLRPYPIRDTFSILNCMYDTLNRRTFSEPDPKRRQVLEDCSIFLDTVYGHAGRSLDVDSAFFGKSQDDVSRRTKRPAEIARNGDLAYNAKYAAYTHDNVIDWINDSLESDDSLYEREPRGESYDDEQPKTWDTYRQEIFDLRPIEILREEAAVLLDSIEQLEEISEELPEAEAKELAEESRAATKQFVQKNEEILAIEQELRDAIAHLQESRAEGSKPQTRSVFAPAASSPSSEGELVFGSPRSESAPPSVFSESEGRLTFGSGGSPSQDSPLTQESQRTPISQTPVEFPRSIEDAGVRDDVNPHIPTEQEIEELQIEEMDFALNYKGCPVNISTDIAGELEKLDIDAFTSLFELGKEKPDQRLQKVIQCIIENLSANPDSPNINTIMDKLKRIAKGAYGEVFLANKDNKSLFLVKAALGDEPDDNLYHEAFVGMAALNKLRSWTPAFMYTYHLKTCRKMSQRGATENFTWCSKPNTSQEFLFCENVSNAMTLFDFIAANKLNYMLLANFYLQLESALNLANAAYGFTHYDLHVKNVLIQELDQEARVPIYLNAGEAFYLKSKYVVRIIDYGLARVKLPNGKSYGISRYEAGATYSSYPAHDFSVFTYSAFGALGLTRDSVEKQRCQILLLNLYRRVMKRDLVKDYMFLAGRDRETVGFMCMKKTSLIRKLGLQKSYSLEAEQIAAEINAAIRGRDPSRIKVGAASETELQDSVERGLAYLALLHEYAGNSRKPNNLTSFLIAFQTLYQNLLLASERTEKELERFDFEGDRTVTFYNGYLAPNDELAKVNHGFIIEQLKEELGKDLIDAMIAEGADPSATRTICKEDCKSWKDFEKQLFA